MSLHVASSEAQARGARNAANERPSISSNDWYYDLQANLCPIETYVRVASDMLYSVGKGHPLMG